MCWRTRQVTSAVKLVGLVQLIMTTHHVSNAGADGCCVELASVVLREARLPKCQLVMRTACFHFHRCVTCVPGRPLILWQYFLCFLFVDHAGRIAAVQPRCAGLVPV